MDRPPPAVIPSGTPPARRRMPTWLRLPILLCLNLFLTMTLWSYAAPFMGHELGAISKVPGQEEFALLTPIPRLAYKIGVICTGWWLSYDWIDISALTAITHMPYVYLLTTYYNISLPTAAAVAINEIVAIAIPTYLLRSRSAVNNPNVPLRSRYLLNSSQVNITNILLSIGVYVVVLFSAFKTDQFRSFLVTRFELPTLEGAYSETIFSLIGKLLPAGVATKFFLLNPSLGATPTPGDATPVELFDPKTATLSQTLKHNFWFFSRRTRTLIQQTAIASILLSANTVQRSMSLEGTTLAGAAGYSGIWILANIICAGWWTWVGDAEL
ncbi:hypothetical protein K458DRAFT_345354 [Lentithecium fluviatile CBS 122367]|uniref:Uncharacterized protein n=1 Tax=Lentithecium fluviatile CBS 122367 TaxID=1168545 RepID=A0A6G1IQQ8_9PLEO|nr:hypothetical protein K458DRAFT_345354 [Lentithecium fluviatile CBS 122367]